MLDDKTMEEIREAEERRRNAARFKVWSACWWYRKAKVELKAALADERAAFDGRLAMARDEFEASAFRVGLLGISLLILGMEEKP